MPLSLTVAIIQCAARERSKDQASFDSSAAFGSARGAVQTPSSYATVPPLVEYAPKRTTTGGYYQYVPVALIGTGKGATGCRVSRGIRPVADIAAAGECGRAPTLPSAPAPSTPAPMPSAQTSSISSMDFTDDAPRIQQALNAAGAAGGGIVRLAGTVLRGGGG